MTGSGVGVWSCNEWDPLEEVIVGRVDGAALPPPEPAVLAAVHPDARALIEAAGGTACPEEWIAAARGELDGLAAILQSCGVTVRRPQLVDHTRAFSAPGWRSRSGFNAANPRDVLLVVGDEILEAPTSWRCRTHEAASYRDLIRSYAAAGARWSAAPRPGLADELYIGDGRGLVIGEVEPVFDAADLLRFGRDLLALRSHTSNRAGLDWLRRHLGAGFHVHEIRTRDPNPMHLDTTIMPLAPGRALVNPDYLDIASIPAWLRRWELLIAPRPVPRESRHLPSLCSPWLSINVLSLDPKRVIVEARQEPLIDALAAWGFEPLPCRFEHLALFGGGLHCATLDVRRRGRLESYE
jgi:glycine amidinotransferase